MNIDWWGPSSVPVLHALFISMVNDISNLELLSPKRNGSGAVESALPAPIADAPANEADIETLKASVLAKLTLTIGKDGGAATPRDWFVATALALRDRVIHRWLAVNRTSHAEGRKRVYYLSLEFLIGRLFADVVENLRLTETVKAALGDMGVDLDRMRRAEPDAALGNGGLRRLAACRRDTRAGGQKKYQEVCLPSANPGDSPRPEFTYDIHYGGCVEMVAAK